MGGLQGSRWKGLGVLDLLLEIGDSPQGHVAEDELPDFPALIGQGCRQKFGIDVSQGHLDDDVREGR